jgi:hypothetical protein
VSEKAQGLLYHYTTAQGLIGILESNSLWASNVSYMNDLSELRYTKKLLDEEMMKAVQDDPESDRIAFKNVFNIVIDGFNAYACCFCENGDQLSQWRAYSDSGTGYALGFDESQLQAKLDGVLGTIIYQRDKQLKSIMPTIKKAAVESRKWGEKHGQDRTQRKQFIMETIRKLLWDSLAFFFVFKDPAFEEERESRLIIVNNTVEKLDHVRFREMRGTVVPFIELKVKQSETGNKELLPIIEVVQGPLIEPALGEKSLKLLLRKHGYENVAVKRSKVPIRF